MNRLHKVGKSKFKSRKYNSDHAPGSITSILSATPAAASSTGSPTGAAPVGPKKKRNKDEYKYKNTLSNLRKKASHRSPFTVGLRRPGARKASGDGEEEDDDEEEKDGDGNKHNIDEEEKMEKGAVAFAAEGNSREDNWRKEEAERIRNRELPRDVDVANYDDRLRQRHAHTLLISALGDDTSKIAKASGRYSTGVYAGKVDTGLLRLGAALARVSVPARLGLVYGVQACRDGVAGEVEEEEQEEADGEEVGEEVDEEDDVEEDEEEEDGTVADDGDYDDEDDNDADGGEVQEGKKYEENSKDQDHDGENDGIKGDGKADEVANVAVDSNFLHEKVKGGIPSIVEDNSARDATQREDGGDEYDQSLDDLLNM